MHYSICLGLAKGTYWSLRYPEAKHQLQQQYPRLMNYIPWGCNTTHLAPVGFFYNLAFSPTAHVPDIPECLSTTAVKKRDNTQHMLCRLNDVICHIQVNQI